MLTNSAVQRVSINNPPQVTQNELALYAMLIYDKTGIKISPRKQMLLSNRLRRRLRITGIESFSQYYQYLKKLPADNPEWDAFLQEITTHETYLFRDESQWDWLRKVFIPGLSKKFIKGSDARTLRIWSAACSTGDEAYTIACCVAAHLPNFERWTVKILGTDIGIGAVEQAQLGVFGARAMRTVPKRYKCTYFTESADKLTWKANPILAKMVSFQQHNLLDPFSATPFDLVFLKNVLIYFDMNSKRKVLGNIHRLILPGGILMVGASEGIADITNLFIRMQPWLYRKPLKA
jgi:chemotaxis protein methyltransferase CheR